MENVRGGTKTKEGESGKKAFLVNITSNISINRCLFRELFRELIFGVNFFL